MGIGHSIYLISTLLIALFCVHAPRGRYRAPFFLSHPPPLSDGNLHPAALLRMRGNYFRPYLGIFTCALEMQHSNENSTTMLAWAVLFTSAKFRLNYLLDPRLSHNKGLPWIPFHRCTQILQLPLHPPVVWSSVTKNSWRSLCSLPELYRSFSSSRAKLVSAWTVKHAEPSLMAHNAFAAGKVATLKASTKSPRVEHLRRINPVPTTNTTPLSVRKVQWTPTPVGQKDNWYNFWTNQIGFYIALEKFQFG